MKFTWQPAITALWCTWHKSICSIPQPAVTVHNSPGHSSMSFKYTHDWELEGSMQASVDWVKFRITSGEWNVVYNSTGWNSGLHTRSCAVFHTRNTGRQDRWRSSMLWKQALGWTGACLGTQIRVRDCSNKQEIWGRMGYSWKKGPKPVRELHWVPASG